MAGRTGVISLPKAWLTTRGIKKGDSLELEEQGASILIKQIGVSSSGLKTSIDISNTLPMTTRIIAALYKAGYDEFDVQYSTQDELDAIQRVVRQGFIGFELLHAGKHHVTIKKVTQPDASELPAVFRRMLHLITLSAHESLDAMKQHDKEWLQSIITRDQDVNKLADFCRRMHAQQQHPRASQHNFITDMFEKVGDAYADACKAALEHKPSKQVLELHHRLNTYLEQVSDAYLVFTLEKMPGLGTTNMLLRQYSFSIAPKIAPEEIPVWFYLNQAREFLFAMTSAMIVANV